MRKGGAETVAVYYREIPGMIKLLRAERQALEDEYNGLRAPAIDGLPHGSAPGMPTEALALRTAEAGVMERLREIEARLHTLDADAATIRRSLDALGSKYKRMILLRVLCNYSWARISVKLGVPDSTVRYWYRLALERLAAVLEEESGVSELERRASRARSL